MMGELQVPKGYMTVEMVKDALGNELFGRPISIDRARSLMRQFDLKETRHPVDRRIFLYKENDVAEMIAKLLSGEWTVDRQT